MRTLYLFFSSKKMFLTATLWGLVEVAFFPNRQLIYCLIAAMAIDLLTGLIKSWNLGKSTTSIGFRKTVTKVVMYVSIITGTWVLANLLSQMYGKADYSPIVNLTIGFLSFIELYSVFENVYSISPSSTLSRYIAKPFLKLLRGMLDRADKTIQSHDPLNNPTNTDAGEPKA